MKSFYKKYNREIILNTKTLSEIMWKIVQKLYCSYSLRIFKNNVFDMCNLHDTLPNKC